MIKSLHIKKQNVKHGDIVCMLFDKSLEMIISILSVLKLSASYLPIDITYPKDRIDYIINDSHSKIVLTTKGITAPLPSSISTLYVDLDNAEIMITPYLLYLITLLVQTILLILCIHLVLLESQKV